MQTTDFLREGYRQLSDTEFYTKLKEDPTLDISKKICKVLTDMKNLKIITEKNFDYLNVKHPKAGRFYLLPKIHKKNIPGRPICSSIGHPTCNISKVKPKVKSDHIKRFLAHDFLSVGVTLETSRNTNKQDINTNFGNPHLTLKEGPKVKSDHTKRFAAHDFLDFGLPFQSSRTNNK